MAAVAIYALPPQIPAWAVPARSVLLGLVSPYLQITSQWQQWDLFSPDPYTRVSTYVFETRDAEGKWLPAGVIDARSFPVPRRAAFNKLFNNVLDDPASPFGARLLQHLCTGRGLSAGTAVRMNVLAYVLPHPDHPASVAAWRAWVPSPAPLWTIDGICEEGSAAFPLVLP